MLEPLQGSVAMPPPGESTPPALDPPLPVAVCVLHIGGGGAGAGPSPSVCAKAPPLLSALAPQSRDAPIFVVWRWMLTCRDVPSYAAVRAYGRFLGAGCLWGGGAARREICARTASSAGEASHSAVEMAVADCEAHGSGPRSFHW